MAKDTITGIKIGNAIYQEGQSYTGGGALTNLLNKIDLGALSLGDFEAEIDIRANRLTLFLSTTVSSFPSKVKVIFAGDAIINAANNKRADDFTIERAGAGIHADAGFFGVTEAIGNVRTKAPTSLNQGLRGLLKGRQPLRNARLSTAKVYSEGVITGLIAPKLEELNITTTDRASAAGPFAGAFSNQPTQEWWSTGV